MARVGAVRSSRTTCPKWGFRRTSPGVDASVLTERMAFVFRLETTDGRPAEPPEVSTGIPTWKPGDVIYLGRWLRVLAVREEEGDRLPVLVVEEVAR
jgi:hypothetical protein